MIAPFQSPLLGTAIVIAGMSATAIPLVRLTSHNGDAQKPAIHAPSNHQEVDTIPAVLRIRTLIPLDELQITSADETVLHHAIDLEAGELETDVALPWENGETFLAVSARAGEQETAVFLTLMPDGYEEQTAFTIGSGEFGEELSFEWKTE